VFLLSKYQASGLAEWRPALWMPGIRDCHRAQVAWTLGCHSQTLIQMLPSALKSLGFHIYHKDASSISCGKLSNEIQNLHYVTISVVESDETSCVVEVTSGSACVFPAWVPLSLLWGALLFWVPFPDCGENLKILTTLKRQMLTFSARYNHGIICTDQKLIERGSSCTCASAAPKRSAFFIVFIVFPALLFLTIINLLGIGSIY